MKKSGFTFSTIKAASMMFALLLLSVTHLDAMELNELFSRRDGFQRNIQKQLETRIKAILPDDMVMVKTEVPLHVFYDKPKDTVFEDVVLGKLGTADPIGGKVHPRRRIARASFMENVQQVKVDVFLDHSIALQFEEEIRNIVQALLRDVPQTKIDLTFSRILFKQSYMHEEVANLNVKAKEHAPMLIGTGVFFFMGILIVALIGWLKGGMRSLRHLADRALDVMEQKARHPVVPEKIIISTGSNPEQAPAASSNVTSLHKAASIREELTIAKQELSHLVAVASGRQARLVHLIREWVYKNSEEAIAALMLLPEVLGTDLFASTIAALSEEERVLWSTQLSRTIASRDIVLGKSFIKSHSHELLVDAHGAPDMEIHQLGITTEEYVEIIYKDVSLGAQMIKGLPDGQVKMIMKKLPKGYISKVIEASMQAEHYRRDDAMNKVKNMLNELRDDRFRALPPSYVDYIVQQLHDVGPQREAQMLKMFRTNGRMEILQNVVKQVFPSELILEMPTSFLRSVLQDFDLNERARLIALAKQEQRKQLLLCAGEKDAPERMAIDVEVERIDNDIRALKELKEKSEQIWSDFYKRARSYIRGNPELERQANFLLDRWLFQAAATDKKFSDAA